MSQIQKLFETLGHDPQDKEAWNAAWDMRLLYSFALKRSRDAAYRGQTPRESWLRFLALMRLDQLFFACLHNHMACVIKLRTREFASFSECSSAAGPQ